jgi:hypothetical protein
MIRRGESGWVEVVWAFMVARGWGMRPVHRRASISRRTTAGDHKGPPNHTSSTLAPTDIDAYSPSSIGALSGFHLIPESILFCAAILDRSSVRKT